MIITGKEKAFVGGLGAGITTFAGQLSVGGKLDAQTVAWSVGAWVATHLFVYYTTNSEVDKDVVPSNPDLVGPQGPPGPAGPPAESTPPAAPSA
jgi:hypothetical protein